MGSDASQPEKDNKRETNARRSPVSASAIIDVFVSRSNMIAYNLLRSAVGFKVAPKCGFQQLFPLNVLCVHLTDASPL